METQKNFFHLLGEWWDAQQARRREAAAQPRPLRRLPHLLPTPGNAIFTLVMIALLVAAQTAGALPLGEHRGVAPTAASTGTIAYQGRLADAAGAPLTGTYNMIFRLYAAATGGTPLWEENWNGSNGVRVSDGLFNVMLGSLNAIPAALISGHTSLFLGITVGTDDEMAPRVQLGSVPYAVQALTVPDGSVTTAKIADGAVTQVKLGTDVSLTPPDGSITAAKLADGAVTRAKAPQFLKSVHRQDHVVDNLSQINQYLTKGWGCWGPTDGTTAVYVRSVTFPVTYSDVPIITISLAGDSASPTPPGSHGGLFFDMGYRPVIAALGQNASGFSAQLVTNSVYPSGHLGCFTWIAIGTLAS